MNGKREKQIKYAAAHLCLAGKIFLFYTLLSVNLALAGQVSCDLFTYDKEPYIDQNALSELLFGVERSKDEITPLYGYLNEIGSISISYAEFKELEICLAKTDSRFFIRNRDVLLMALFGRIDNLSLLSNRNKELEKSKVIDILFKGDIYEIGTAINATAIFRDEDAVDALGRLALESEKMIIIDDVLSALHFIGTEAAKVKMIELKSAKPNFSDDIDDYLQHW